MSLVGVRFQACGAELLLDVIDPGEAVGDEWKTVVGKEVTAEKLRGRVFRVTLEEISYDEANEPTSFQRFDLDAPEVSK